MPVNKKWIKLSSEKKVLHILEMGKVFNLANTAATAADLQSHEFRIRI